MSKNEKRDKIIINKEVIYWVLPAIAIIAVLLSKHKTAEILLFVIGIISGIRIAKGYFKK